MKPPIPFILTCSVVTLITTGGTHRASADVFDWNTPATADFGTAGNWTNENGGAHAVPTTGNVANLINGATVTVGAGDNYAADEVWVGNNATDTNDGVGHLLVSGGMLTANNWLQAGRSGSTGSITQTGGTILQNNAGARTIIGDANGSHGTLTISGASSVFHTVGTLSVGDNGGSLGTMTVSDAAVTVDGETWVGNNSSNANVLTLNSGSYTANNWVAVGRDVNGVGTLNINGGTFTRTAGANGFLDISTRATSNGVVNLNGGVLVTDKIISEGGNGTLNFNGGTLRANADGTRVTNGVSAVFASGVGTFNVRNGGAAVDTNGFNITFGQALTHSNVGGDNATDGGLTKQGTGMLTLSGANTYTGITTISAGTLALAASGSIANSAQIRVAAGAVFDVSAAGSFTIGTGQTLTGKGTVTSAALTFSGGTLAPGSTPTPGNTGTLSIANSGPLTLSNTSTLQFDILSATNKDLITANGALNIVGNNTLALNLGTGLTPGTYTLFSGLTSESGAFTTVTGLSAGEMASFNFNGGNYNLVISVPEPSTWVLGVFGLGMAGLWLRQCRRAC